jgi:DNA-binding MarR family transcriptional regulator
MAFLADSSAGAQWRHPMKEHDRMIGTADEDRFVYRYLASMLALASHRISAEFHVEVRKAGLTVTEWRILASLLGGAGETVGELARLAITKQPTLSKVLPRLETQGLITLGSSRADRRQTLVKITAKGTRLIEGLCERAMAHQRRVLSKLDPDHADRLVGMLRAIIAE